MLSLIRSRGALVYVIPTLLVILATAAPGYMALAQRMDDGALLLYPELILKGWVPYRDFETFYGPANSYLLAIVYGLFGPGLFVARTVGLIYHLAILSAVFYVIRIRGIALAIGAVLIAHLFLLPTGLSPRAWVGGLACALWSLALAGDAKASDRVFLAGLLGGLALLFRPDLAPALLLSAGLLLIFHSAKMRWLYLAGLVLGIIPLLVVACVAGFRNVFDNLFLYPVIITNSARKLPWSALSPYLAYLISFLFLAAIINLIAGFIVIRKDPTSLFNRLFAALAILGLATTHQALQRMDGGHVTLCCFVVLALFPVALGIMAEQWFKIPSSVIRDLFLITLSLLVVAGLAPELVHNLHRALGIGGHSKSDEVALVQYKGRRFPVNSIAIGQETGELLDNITKLSSAGERLFVGPADLRRTNYNDTFLYYLLPQLVPATYFLEMNPLSANRPRSRLTSDILSADWLILDHRLDDWNEQNESARFGPDDPNQAVKSHFELEARVGPYDIYRKN